MSKFFKRTKILATIGPSVFGAEKIEEIISGTNYDMKDRISDDQKEKASMTHEEQRIWLIRQLLEADSSVHQL